MRVRALQHTVEPLPSAQFHLAQRKERLFRWFIALIYVENCIGIVILLLFYSSDKWCFQQLSAISAGENNYSMTLFASHALTLFVFWSGLPLASNGLPSTHKSHLCSPFDFFSLFSLAMFLLSVPHLCLREAIFCHKKWSDNARPRFPVLGKALLQALRATNVNHRKAIMRVK